MRILLLIVSLTILPCVAIGQEGKPTPNSREEGVANRGNHVMGFSHEAATHHFHLFKDGGEIVVTANLSDDVSTRDQIRMHLGHIAKMFAAGNFNAPMIIHDTNPPGVATMTKRKEQIRYEFSEVERGAKIRIVAVNSETIDAIHAFLLFQILDHHTGDSAAILDERARN
jgi:hypothetical protein